MQPRAAMRRARFLEVAARLIGELGYEAVTMTAIAKEAEASIGALYDYFPDKESLAIALTAQVVAESDAHWKRLLANPSSLTKDALAELFVEGALELVRERPAYLPLFDAPIAYTRSNADREPLRRAFAVALQAASPELADDQAFLRAQVIVELIKALLRLYKQAPAQTRELAPDEFKKLIRLYLGDASSQMPANQA